MKKALFTLSLLFVSAGLTACNTLWSSDNDTSSRQQVAQRSNNGGLDQPTSAGTRQGALVGENSMDEGDKSKMWKALDKPVGKSSSWVNPSTGISYTVVPEAKISVSGNPFCRRYSVTAEKNSNQRQFSGTACVGADSNWQPTSGS